MKKNSEKLHGFLKCKKGSIFDILFLMVGMIIIGMVIFFVFLMLNRINTEYQKTETEALPKAIMQDNTTKYPIIFNSAFLFIYIGLTLVACISAFMIDTHPIFFIIVLFMMALLVIISMALSNTMEAVFTNPSLSAEAQQFGTLKFYFDNMPMFILISSLMVGVSLFIRPQQQ